MFLPNMIIIKLAKGKKRKERKDNCIHSCNGIGISVVYISYYSIKYIHNYVYFYIENSIPYNCLYICVFLPVASLMITTNK